MSTIHYSPQRKDRILAILPTSYDEAVSKVSCVGNISKQIGIEYFHVRDSLAVLRSHKLIDFVVITVPSAKCMPTEPAKDKGLHKTKTVKVYWRLD